MFDQVGEDLHVAGKRDFAPFEFLQIFVAQKAAFSPLAARSAAQVAQIGYPKAELAYFFGIPVPVSGTEYAEKPLFVLKTCEFCPYPGMRGKPVEALYDRSDPNSISFCHASTSSRSL